MHSVFSNEDCLRNFIVKYFKALGMNSHWFVHAFVLLSCFLRFSGLYEVFFSRYDGRSAFCFE